MNLLNKRGGFLAVSLMALALLVAVLAGGLYLGEGRALAAGAAQANPAPAEQQAAAPVAQATRTGTQGIGTGIGDNQMPAGISHQMAQSGPVPGVKNTSQQAAMVADVSFTLRTDVGEKGLAFVGVGGTIDGQVNPKLVVAEGAVVQITLVNGDGALHDVVFPDFGGATEQVASKGASTTTVFKADKAGEFAYFCSVPGHRQAGMEGLLVVGEGESVEETGADIVMDPAEVPAPVGSRGPQNLEIDAGDGRAEGPAG